MTQRGVFREVTPPERLVLTELFDEQSYPGETVITHVFTEAGGATTVRSRIRYATPEGRARVLAYPMARGVAEAHERLDAVLHDLADPTTDRTDRTDRTDHTERHAP
jgi:uncharacterized protein YndB with AHSA1/START domain